MRDRRVSEAVIHRLPKYYRHLQDLQARGIERISSGELSVEMGFNASQIRQDFNCFGGFGQQGYGYQVSVLLRELGSILGLTRVYNLAIIGAGNIGKALARYSGFTKEGFCVKAVFDIRPEIIGRVLSGVEVSHVDTLNDFLASNQIDIGVICTQGTLTGDRGEAREWRRKGHMELRPHRCGGGRSLHRKCASFGQPVRPFL